MKFRSLIPDGVFLPINRRALRRGKKAFEDHDVASLICACDTLGFKGKTSPQGHHRPNWLAMRELLTYGQSVRQNHVDMTKAVFELLCPRYLSASQIFEAAGPMVGCESAGSTESLWAVLEWFWQPHKICGILVEAIERSCFRVNTTPRTRPKNDGGATAGDAREHSLLVLNVPGRTAYSAEMVAYFVVPSYADSAKAMFKICVGHYDEHTGALVGLKVYGAYNDLETAEREFENGPVARMTPSDSLRKIPLALLRAQ